MRKINSWPGEQDIPISLWLPFLMPTLFCRQLINPSKGKASSLAVKRTQSLKAYDQHRRSSKRYTSSNSIRKATIRRTSNVKEACQGAPVRPLPDTWRNMKRPTLAPFATPLINFVSHSISPTFSSLNRSSLCPFITLTPAHSHKHYTTGSFSL